MIQSKFNSRMTAALVGATTFAMSVVPCFAVTGLTTAIKNVIGTVGQVIQWVINPVCTIALAICLVTLIVGKNSKSAEAAISWGKRIIAAFVIFNLLGTIVNFMGSLGNAGTKSTWSDWKNAGQTTT